QVGSAGAIVVAEVDSHGASGDAIFAERDSRRHGFFGEGSVLVVAVQLVRLRVVGEEEIGPAVAVDVRRRDAERFASRLAEAGLLRYVLKFAVAEIAIEFR